MVTKIYDIQLPQANRRNQMKTPNCFRQIDETKWKRPIASGKWTKPNENAQLPQANGRNQMKTPNCLRQMDETKWKHPIASGKWTKPNENAQLPQANRQNQTKTPNCLRQMDNQNKWGKKARSLKAIHYIRFHPLASLGWTHKKNPHRKRWGP